MATTIAAPGIRIDERGTAWIEGTSTKVLQVVRCQQAEDLTAEQLQDDHQHLTLAQIRAALAYYEDHREEVEADIARRDEWVRELMATQPKGHTREELLARLAQRNGDGEAPTDGFSVADLIARLDDTR